MAKSSAMILAAGLGTRLRPLTLELPKPLLPVGDRPSIAHIAACLAAAGIEGVVLNIHHLAEAFTEQALAQVPLAVHLIHEPAILGTAGGLRNARDRLAEGDVVVWNGDILIDLDAAALLDAHRREGAGATLAVAPRAVGEGTVGLGEDGRVVRLRGHRFGDEARGGDFTGVHVIGAGLRDRLPSEGCLVGDVYLPALREGARLASFPAPAEWDDIGSIAAYLAANRRWLVRRRLPSFVGAGVIIGDAVDPSATVIGAGAVVEGEGALRGCVVWPGARASAPLEDAVVTPLGVARAKPPSLRPPS